MIISLIFSIIKDNFKYLLFAIAVLVCVFGGSKLIRDYYLETERNMNDGKTVTISLLERENQNLKERKEEIDKNFKIDDREIVSNIEEKEVIRKKVSDTKLNLKEKVNKINEQYKDVSKIEDNETRVKMDNQRIREISTVRINSLWDTYCAATDDQTQCKEINNA